MNEHDDIGNGTNDQDKNPTRKRRRSSRFMVLREIEHQGEGPDVYEVVGDGFKSDAAAIKACSGGDCSGHVIVVCIHRDGKAAAETLTTFKWSK